MTKILRNWFLLGVLIFSLFALVACDGDGGGAPIVPPGGGTPPPGDGQPPGDGTQPPATPAADTFAWTGNTPLTVAAAQGLLANDPAGSVIASIDTTTTQGTVDVTLATGAFTYTPPVGAQNVADTFTYTVTGFAPVTVTINLAERIWYVNNTSAAGGNGTFASPFNTLAAAGLASDANDTIFVFAGDGQATGQNVAPLTLQSGQKLLGQGVGLRFNGVPIVDAGANAVISGGAAGNIPVLMLSTAAGNEVAGLTINATQNEAILALGGTGHNLHDNTITVGAGTGREGIRLLNVTGSNTVFANTITGALRDGIKLANNEDQAGNPVAATTITGTVTMSRNTISNSAQDGININLDGTGTAVTLNILTNTITNSAANEGININSLGAASITNVISRNTISNSNQEAIDLSASGSPGTKAFVANNALSLNDLVGQGFTDFRAANVNAGATFCLELVNNVNATANSTFQVDNGVNGIFQFFELGNDTLAARAPANLITNVAEGACAIPLNGAALFVANCSICHNGNGLGLQTKKQILGAPDITNATTTLINVQLGPGATNIDMAGIRLTQQEILAIAIALAAGP